MRRHGANLAATVAVCGAMARNIHRRECLKARILAEEPVPLWRRLFYRTGNKAGDRTRQANVSDGNPRE